uniref:Uncharacterized protein n=1 Tax=Candidatus Kentrum sp. DK TaxID=2126562 RepID=A0A450TD13_9GAMM|nr:MAG: hypothetical protein BECKDK2373C_GA0170839_11229 [Candidatus Kentron sp. DK]
MVGSYKKAANRCLFELYAKVGSTPLTALKTSSKCSFIPYKLRFLVSFRLVGRSRYAAELATLTGLGGYRL